MTNPKITVSLVEDTPTVREMLSDLLNETDDLVVVGSYATGKAAIKGLKETPSQVLVADLGLPDMSGIEVIRFAAQMTPKIDAIAYTVFDDEMSLFGAVKAGAVGYLLKDSSSHGVVEAVREAVRGGAMITPALARRLLGEFSVPVSPDMPDLTPRERQVLEHLVQGANYLNVGNHSLAPV